MQAFFPLIAVLVKGLGFGTKKHLAHKKLADYGKDLVKDEIKDKAKEKIDEELKGRKKE